MCIGVHFLPTGTIFVEIFSFKAYLSYKGMFSRRPYVEKSKIILSAGQFWSEQNLNVTYLLGSL